MMTYTNCSQTEVAFDSMGQPVLQATMPVPPGNPNLGSQPVQPGDEDAIEDSDTTSNPAQGDINQPATQIPDDELAQRRPLTDLETDPTLTETYRCGQENGILICHFPNNVENASTRCIAQKAVPAHAKHIRTVTVDGEAKTFQDYLGPCR
jgi:hypothetical protein